MAEDNDPFGGSVTESEGEDAPDDASMNERDADDRHYREPAHAEESTRIGSMEDSAQPSSNAEPITAVANGEKLVDSGGSGQSEEKKMVSETSEKNSDGERAMEVTGEFEAVMARFMLLEDRAARKVFETVLDESGDILTRAAEMEVARLHGGGAKTEDGKIETEGSRGSATATESLNLEKPQKRERKEKISKRQLKALLRPDVATLKLNCARPDVVEVWDTTAPDPRTLVWLKAYRNTVKVPIHWNQKRKYLSGKRAVEKLPFKLPDYIEQTKIGEIRAALLEKESQKSLKQKQREKSRPKSNRMHVDFQTLHDAFFKYATKPELSQFADLYYEGKEREEKTRQFKPGQLSSKLREALGIVLPSQPAPWIIPMQRYGPPPSYPNLKVAGVNAPLPTGGQWGVHAGGWGKPPSDHFGNPLYPSVFMEPTAAAAAVPQEKKEDLANLHFWGEVLELDNDDDDDEDDDDDNEPEDETGTEDEESTAAALGGRRGSMADDDGTRSVASSDRTGASYHHQSGTASVISGTSTPRVDDVWAMLGGNARR